MRIYKKIFIVILLAATHVYAALVDPESWKALNADWKDLMHAEWSNKPWEDKFLNDVKKGDLAAVEKWIKEANRREHYSSAIPVAALYGKMAILDYLLRRNLNVNYKNELTGDTALLIATGINPDEAIVKRLLREPDIDVNAQSELTGNTALHNAVLLNRPEMVKLLLARKADTTIKNNAGETPYDIAQRKGREAIKSLLLEQAPHQRDKKNNIINNISNLK